MLVSVQGHATVNALSLFFQSRAKIHAPHVFHKDLDFLSCFNRLVQGMLQKQLSVIDRQHLLFIHEDIGTVIGIIEPDLLQSLSRIHSAFI